MEQPAIPRYHRGSRPLALCPSVSCGSNPKRTRRNLFSGKVAGKKSPVCSETPHCWSPTAPEPAGNRCVPNAPRAPSWLPVPRQQPHPRSRAAAGAHPPHMGSTNRLAPAAAFAEKPIPQAGRTIIENPKLGFGLVYGFFFLFGVLIFKSPWETSERGFSHQDPPSLTPDASPEIALERVARASRLIKNLLVIPRSGLARRRRWQGPKKGAPASQEPAAWPGASGRLGLAAVSRSRRQSSTGAARPRSRVPLPFPEPRTVFSRRCFGAGRAAPRPITGAGASLPPARSPSRSCCHPLPGKSGSQRPPEPRPALPQHEKAGEAFGEGQRGTRSRRAGRQRRLG